MNPLLTVILLTVASITSNDSSGPVARVQVNARGIVNGASYTATGLAPGSLFSVFGNELASRAAPATGSPLPTSLEDATLRVNGVLAPLYYVSPNQVNAQVPWELAGQSQATLVVANGTEVADPQTVLLAPFGPGLFMFLATGTLGQGAILDTLARLVDGANPAREGSVLQIYATGLGAVTVPQTNGMPAPGGSTIATTTVPTVTIGGRSAAVSFSGLAPGFVGLYQVNVTVPAGVLPGRSVPVVLTIGGVSSNTVTIAVE